MGMPPVSGLTRLEDLCLAGLGLRDRDCTALTLLVRLTALDLSDNELLRDASCQQLSALQRLQSLDLMLTAATAPPLLPSLTGLHMANCRVKSSALPVRA
jgi:hypothetical protein